MSDVVIEDPSAATRRGATGDPSARPVGEDASPLARLVRHGSVYALALGVQIVAALIAVPLLTRLLSPAAYGRVAGGLAILTAFGILLAGGLPEAASRRFFEGAAGQDAARGLVISIAITAVPIAALVDLTSLLWAPALGLHHPAVLRVAVGGAPAAAVLLGGQALLRVRERPWAFFVVVAIAAFGGQGLGLAATALFGTASAYLAGLLAGVSLAAVAGLWLGGAVRGGPAPAAELRAGLRFGTPLAIHGVAVAMLVSVDRLVISAVLGLAATGRYAVAYAVGGLGVALIAAFNQSWMPVMLGTATEHRWQVLQSTSRTMHAIAVVIAATLALLAPAGLVIAAPASYHVEALIPVAALVAASALPYATCGTYFLIAFLSGRTRVMAFAAPAGVLAGVGLDLVLLGPTKLIGAGVATLLSYVLLAVLVAIRSRRLVALPGTARESLLSWLTAAPAIAAGALLPTDGLGWALRLVALALVLGVTWSVVRRQSDQGYEKGQHG